MSHRDDAAKPPGAPDDAAQLTLFGGPAVVPAARKARIAGNDDAVLPVTDPEATPNPDDPDAAGSGTAASTQGRVVDGLCVPESETS